MGAKEGDGGRRLVDLARLDADQPVLHVVDAPDAVLAGPLVEALDEGHAVHLLAVEGDGHAPLEANLDIARLVGRFVRRARPDEDLLRRLLPGVLQDAALDAAAPEVLVDGVGALLGDGDRDVVRCGVGDLLLAGHAPLAHRRDDLQVGRQGLCADVEAHLVVALAGGAVADRRGPFLAGHVHHQLGDERPRQGRGEGILALVEGAGGQGREDEVAHEEVAPVTDDGLDGAGGLGALLHLRDVALLAHVDGEGDDVVAALLLQPADGHGGIEAAGVGKDNLFSHGMLSLVLLERETLRAISLYARARAAGRDPSRTSPAPAPQSPAPGQSLLRSR